MSYKQRRIQVIFELGQGTFGTSGTPNTVTLDGLRCSATVVLAGGLSLGSMQLRVWGMTPADMQKLYTLGLVMLTMKKNHVTLKAGDAGGELSTVYRGDIFDGYLDANDMPNVCFHVAAYIRAFDKVQPSDPITLKAPVKVSDAMKMLAGKVNPPLEFEDGGVDVTMDDEYLPGTALDKINKLAGDAHIEHIIENETLVIWPRGGHRKTAKVTVSPQTGMIGYPSFTGYGVLVSTLFDPRLKHGALVDVQSSIQAASKTWQIFTLVHELESEMPGGNWVTRFQACAPKDYVAATLGTS